MSAAAVAAGPVRDDLITLAEGAPYGLVVLSEHLDVIYANAALEGIVGAQPVEQLGQLFRQPIVAVKPDAGSGAHYEVLLRLLSADGELIAPGLFLLAAERFGISERIDSWVVRSTLQ